MPFDIALRLYIISLSIGNRLFYSSKPFVDVKIGDLTSLQHYLCSRLSVIKCPMMLKYYT